MKDYTRGGLLDDHLIQQVLGAHKSVMVGWHLASFSDGLAMLGAIAVFGFLF